MHDRTTLAQGLIALAALASLSPSWIALAQTKPTFEVATVKRSPIGQGDPILINLGTLQGNELSFRNVSLSDLIKYAYGIVSDEQLIAPTWAKEKEVRFDIVARVPVGTTRSDAAEMLKHLLAERLRLALHSEKRELPHIALTVARGGAKVKASSEAKGNPSVPGRIQATSMPMSVLVTLLSRFERQTVIDQTGLKGNYEFTLQYSPENAKGPSQFPTLFTAVQEQLGLRLESRKGPLDVLVVDHAEQMPTEN